MFRKRSQMGTFSGMAAAASTVGRAAGPPKGGGLKSPSMSAAEKTRYSAKCNTSRTFRLFKSSYRAAAGAKPTALMYCCLLLCVRPCQTVKLRTQAQQVYFTARGMHLDHETACAKAPHRQQSWRPPCREGSCRSATADGAHAPPWRWPAA